MEDKTIVEQNHIESMVGSQGWKITRERLATKILQLQNISEYADLVAQGKATLLLKSMQANKRAAEIVYEIFADIEGTAAQARESKEKPKQKSYIKVID